MTRDFDVINSEEEVSEDEETASEEMAPEGEETLEVESSEIEE